MTKIELEDGKYTVKHYNGHDFHALLYGERWRDLTGDKLVMAMVQEIEELQVERDELYSIALWGARRLAAQPYAKFAYDEIEKVTGEKVDRDWRGKQV